MPQPPPDKEKKIPEFDIEEELYLDLEEAKEDYKRNSFSELEDLLSPDIELKLTPDLDISKKSPKNSMKKLEQELANRLKNSLSQPSSALSKIYLQKPDLAIFKKKSKSLNTSLVKGKKYGSSKSAKKLK